jgi:Na+-driven multidrug efflux pump
MIVFRVPLCYLLSHRTPLGVDGLWLGITISAFVGSIGFYLYYRSGWWKTRCTRVLPQEPEDMVSSGMETEAL